MRLDDEEMLSPILTVGDEGLRPAPDRGGRRPTSVAPTCVRRSGEQRMSMRMELDGLDLAAARAGRVLARSSKDALW